MTRSAVVGPVDGEIPQRVRRPLAILSIAGYPIAVLVWMVIGPALGLHQAIAAVVGLTLLAATLFAAYRLYRFRSKMAQAPDDQLDERQRQIRDRAYVDSYRWFVLMTLVVLIAAGILPDLLDRPIELTYEVVNWFVMGAILISIALPSAVVAWREPDLAD
jgi:formate hydrogenlyase subunit 3/multisubunit Na+/H+ antiporter MnhD subunit